MSTPPSALTISVGSIASSPHRVAAAVTRRVLEAHGHRTSGVEAPAEQLFALQARGWLDVLLSAWLPSSHASLLVPHQDRVRVLSPQYHPHQVWAVPSYVPQKDVGEVADLARPSVVARMSGLLRGVETDTGHGSARVLAAYGLDRLGYAFSPVMETAFRHWIRRSIARREWFVVPVLRPHRAVHIHGLRPLEEPKGLLGPAEAASPVIGGDALTHIRPEALTRLESVYLGVDDVEEIDAMLGARNVTALQAADRYLSGRPGLLP
ncbi:glycine betaine ABC transporter substrate-binding protein [Streptomyces seoulensis]